MTRNELLALWPIPDTFSKSRLVAELVMGWKETPDHMYWYGSPGLVVGIWRPSLYIEDAWLVHQKMASSRCYSEAMAYISKLQEAVTIRLELKNGIAELSSILRCMTPDDICLAALLCVVEDDKP